jgi:hypothetical protein
MSQGAVHTIAIFIPPHLKSLAQRIRLDPLPHQFHCDYGSKSQKLSGLLSGDLLRINSGGES